MAANRRTQTINIIGAGPGGLAAAILLAGTGSRVRIFERLPQVGGRCATIGGDGFQFDLGPTFFLYPRVLSEIFEAAGKSLFDEVPMVRLDPQYRLIFGAGGQLDATADIAAMERQISALNPSDGGNFARFMRDNRDKLARFRPALESPFSSWRDALSPSLVKMLPLLRPWLSLDGELSRYFQDPRLRIAFSFQSKYLGMSPFRCPSLFSILSFLEYEHGVWHPIGGCGAVSRRMAEIAEEMGVELHLNEPVASIRFDGRRATGVQTRTGVHPCDALVINADFSRAMEKLVPNKIRKRWSDQKIEQKDFSCSTFMLYLGIEGIEQDLTHHTIYIAEDYVQNLRDIEQDHRLSAIDPSVYVQNPSVTDPSLAPKGCSGLYVLAPVTHQHQNVDWNVEAPKFRAVVLKQLEQRFGIKNLEKRIRYEKMITPNDWDSKYEIYRGATFNLAHSLKQMLHLRPRNRFEDLEGVYLVGGGTHPGSGLPVIYESARITSRLIGEDLGLKNVPQTELSLRPLSPVDSQQRSESEVVEAL